jgi:hypothetical protein
MRAAVQDMLVRQRVSGAVYVEVSSSADGSVTVPMVTVQQLLRNTADTKACMQGLGVSACFYSGVSL